MTQANMPAVAHELTVNVFGTACLLQQQLQSLEERCRTSEEGEARLRQSRAELQGILFLFATVEKTEACATADLARTLARLHNGGSGGTPRRASPTPPHRHGHGAQPQTPTPSPPIHDRAHTSRGSASLARVARALLPLEASSPRGPLCPRLTDAEADPRADEGMAPQPSGAPLRTPESARASMTAAESALARALQRFTSDRERAVGQLGLGAPFAFDRLSPPGSAGPSTSVHAATVDRNGGDVDGACAHTSTPNSVKARQSRLDPRLRIVTLGEHVVMAARPGGDDPAARPRSVPETGAPNGDLHADAPSALAAVPAERLDLGSRASTPGRVDRLGAHEIMPAAGDARVRERSTFLRSWQQKVAGKGKEAAARLGGGSHHFVARKMRSPAHARPPRSRGKAAIVGVAAPILHRNKFGLHWAAIKANRRHRAGNRGADDDTVKRLARDGRKEGVVAERG